MNTSERPFYFAYFASKKAKNRCKISSRVGGLFTDIPHAYCMFHSNKVKVTRKQEIITSF